MPDPIAPTPTPPAPMFAPIHSDPPYVETMPPADKSWPDHLRAFEDDALGIDAPRINGEIEDGRGSLFERLTPEQKAHHAAIKAIVKAEAVVSEARAKLGEAENALKQTIELEGKAAEAVTVAHTAKAEKDAKIKAAADKKAADAAAKAPAQV